MQYVSFLLISAVGYLICVWSSYASTTSRNCPEAYGETGREAELANLRRMIEMLRKQDTASARVLIKQYNKLYTELKDRPIESTRSLKTPVTPEDVEASKLVSLDLISEQAFPKFYHAIQPLNLTDEVVYARTNLELVKSVLSTAATAPNPESLFVELKHRANDLKLSADDKYIAIRGDDTGRSYVQVARTSGENVGRWTGSAYAFSRDSRFVAIADTVSIRVIDLATGKVVRKFSTQTFSNDDRELKAYFQASTIAFAPDGKQIAAFSYGSLNFFEISTGKNTGATKPSNNNNTDIEYSSDGMKLLISNHQTGQISLINRSSPYAETFFSYSRLALAAFSTDGKTIYAISDKGEISLWSVESGAFINILQPASAVGNDRPWKMHVRADGVMIVYTRELGRSIVRQYRIAN